MIAILLLFFAIITNGNEVYSLNCYQGCEGPRCIDKRIQMEKNIDHKEKVCEDIFMVCAVKKMILRDGKNQTVQDCFDANTADENLRVLGIKNIFHTVGQCKRYLNGNYTICLCNDGNLCNKASMLDIISNESNSNIVKPNIFIFLIASFMFCILIQNYE